MVTQTPHEELLAAAWDAGKDHVQYVLSEIRSEFVSAPGTLLVGGWLLRALMGPVRRAAAGLSRRSYEVDVVFTPDSMTSPAALAQVISRFGGVRIPFPGRVENDPPWSGHWRMNAQDTRRLDLVNAHTGTDFLLGTDISLSSFGLSLNPWWLRPYDASSDALTTGVLYATESALQDLADGVFQTRRETSSKRISKMQAMGFRPRGRELLDTRRAAVPGWFDDSLSREAHLDSSRNVALPGDRLVSILVTI